MPKRILAFLILLAIALVSMSGAPLAVTPAPFNLPTPQISATQPATTSGPPLSLTLILLSVCCVMLLLFGVMALGIILARQSRREDGNAPNSDKPKPKSLSAKATKI